MIIIKTNKPLEEFKTEIAKGFSAVELLVGGVSFVLMISVALFCTFYAGIYILFSLWIGTPFLVIPLLFAFYKTKNNLSLFEVLRTKLNNVFKDPLVYESNEEEINDYYF